MIKHRLIDNPYFYYTDDMIRVYEGDDKTKYTYTIFDIEAAKKDRLSEDEIKEKQNTTIIVYFVPANQEN